MSVKLLYWSQADGQHNDLQLHQSPGLCGDVHTLCKEPSQTITDVVEHCYVQLAGYRIGWTS